MRYSRVFLDSLGYELGPVVVSTKELEERLRPAFAKLRVPVGQVEALTGIKERRWWEPRTALSQGAVSAARKALAQSTVKPEDIGALIYAGVCREDFEPATACRVADAIGVGNNAAIYDLSNACLGVLNGILDIANRIELGQIRAGLVVSCESAQEIVEAMSAKLLEEGDMERFKSSLATLTGGSGAVAALVTDGSFGKVGHRLAGGITLAAPEHHRLCQWGLEGEGSRLSPFMTTDAVGVLEHGVKLGRKTWRALMAELGWQPNLVDRVICHQVGAAHQRNILAALGIPASKDYSTYEFLGNMGTAALPVTAALAKERGILKSGQKVAFLGIGSGLNCLMLGWEW